MIVIFITVDAAIVVIVADMFVQMDAFHGCRRAVAFMIIAAVAAVAAI